MGLVYNTAPYYQLADYLFMTSLHEGLSYSVLEAFKYKVVVICNKINGVSELVKHKHNGFVVKENNKDDYFDIFNLCEQKNNLKEKIISTSKKTIKKYDQKIFLEKYLEFIKKYN